MKADELREELVRRGLEILGVTEHHANAEVLVIYLHGNAGQWTDGAARRLVGQVRGVVAVSESVSSPTILLALVELNRIEVKGK